MSDRELVVLGTASQMPTRHRNHNGYLLLWGEEDRALGKELTAGTERFVPNLTLSFLPRTSHWAQQDSPALVNAEIEAWLATHGKGANDSSAE